MKIKVGDTVKVIEEGSHMQNIGDTGCVVKVDNSGRPYQVRMHKNNICYWFYEEEIELISFKKPTKQELLKMPMGTKITTDAKEDNVFVKTDNGIYGTIDDREDIETAFYNEADDEIIDDEINDDLSLDEDLTYGTKIIKIEVPTYETVYDSSEKVKEMTMDEICKALGYNVKIIKEEN